MPDKIATTDHPIEPSLAQRWSPRAFSARMLDAGAVASLFEAARWAPSASNSQPWAFVYGLRGSAAFDLLVGCLKPSNAEWARHASLLAMAIAKTNKDDGSANAYTRYDLGQSVAHLTFQAMAMGLHVHQMAGFEAEIARKTLQIPDSHEPVVAISIGYIGEPSQLSPTLQEREIAPRTRKRAGSFVFEGPWPASDRP